MSGLSGLTIMVLKSLNPYSNGRYSMSAGAILFGGALMFVLILILMEDTLWEIINQLWQTK